MFSPRYVVVFFPKKHVYSFLSLYFPLSLLTLLSSDSQVLLVSLLCWNVLCNSDKTGKRAPSIITKYDLTVKPGQLLSLSPRFRLATGLLHELR